MKAVVLAGGLGSRLQPFTEVIPKPLLPLGERAVTEVQLQQLQDAGCTDVFIASNYMSRYIQAFLGDGDRYGVRLHYSIEQKPLGTCGPLSLLRESLANDPFLVLNGDVLTKLSFRDFYEHGASAPAVLTVGTKVITTPFRFGNVQVDADDFIIGVDEKPELAIEIVAGVYVMQPSIFSFIPNDTYFGMDQLITGLLDGGHKVRRYLIKDYWLDIGQVEDYTQARREFSENFGVA